MERCVEDDRCIKRRVSDSSSGVVNAQDETVVHL